MRPKRNRREMAFDRNTHYNGLEKADISQKAKESYERKAYQQPKRLIRAQGQQMIDKDVAEYYAEKFGIEVEKNGTAKETDAGTGTGSC